MESIIFHCEIITPMFLAGADGRKPELRAPSIKGALRYWWRACNGNLPLAELKAKEEEIFGGPNLRSRLIIRILDNPHRTKTENLLPHKSNDRHRSPQECFPSGEKFTVKVSSVKNETITIDQIKALFELVTVLGGLGKRSRRGFGSFKIVKVNGTDYELLENTEYITNLCKKINPNFSTQSSAKYPVIEKIEIGQHSTSLYKIGEATHNEKRDNNSRYAASIGDGRHRFASPIYISILPSGRPVITTLKTFSPNPHQVDERIQNNLKNRILS